MNARFDFNGYTIHVGGRHIVEPPNCCSPICEGMVPFSMTKVAIRSINDEPQANVEHVCGFYLKPSEARALASAILSAATEAR